MSLFWFLPVAISNMIHSLQLLFHKDQHYREGKQPRRPCRTTWSCLHHSGEDFLKQLRKTKMSRYILAWCTDDCLTEALGRAVISRKDPYAPGQRPRDNCLHPTPIIFHLFYFTWQILKSKAKSLKLNDSLLPKLKVVGKTALTLLSRFTRAYQRKLDRFRKSFPQPNQTSVFQNSLDINEESIKEQLISRGLSSIHGSLSPSAAH